MWRAFKDGFAPKVTYVLIITVWVRGTWGELRKGKEFESFAPNEAIIITLSSTVAHFAG